MKVIKSNIESEVELPLQLKISFKKVFDLYDKYTGKDFINHPFHGSALQMVDLFKKQPELIEGFSDYTLLDKHKDKIDLLLNPLFPEPLLLNEIKAASIPFSFTSFKFTDRFENILKNAGDKYELSVHLYTADSLKTKGETKNFDIFAEKLATSERTNSQYLYYWNNDAKGSNCALLITKTPLPPSGNSTHVKGTCSNCSIKCTSELPTSTTSSPCSVK